MARTMRAVEVTKPGTPFRLVERPIPDPARAQVRIAVEACGVCHSDAYLKEGHFPGVVYPRVPGHEVIGRVDAVGDGVTAWKPGQRVGVGWHGGHCFVCEACRSGDFILCENGLICGFSYDGGYAEYMIAPQEALAAVPGSLDSVAAAPLLCAGVTTFNSLRNTSARPGDLVAVHAIGGLGHLGIQYARKLGFRTVALSRGADKRALALELGAHDYIDTDKDDPAAALQKLGGARVILATAPSGAASSSTASLAMVRCSFSGRLRNQSRSVPSSSSASAGVSRDGRAAPPRTRRRRSPSARSRASPRATRCSRSTKSRKRTSG